jgi:hypothetical protein
MFNLGVNMWNTAGKGTFKEDFSNAYSLRDKQFKTWWNPLHPRVEVVSAIQNWMVQKLDIIKTYRKYYH